MTVTVAQLKALANERFTEPSQIGETIVRFIRRTKSAPFAVYYFDITKDLPRTSIDLADYQTRILAERYFTEAKSLQWNTYLFFIPPQTTTKAVDFAEVRSMIEADRGYARKHVISEDDLPEVFNPSFEASNDTLQTENILSVWTERLQKAGIDEIVWQNADAPTRLDAIEASKAKKLPTRTQDTSSKPPPAAEMLREIRLIDYRLFPRRRTIQFGRVNLICGANAAGKTSLLEAIELLYCGRHYRTPNGNSSFDIQATFFSGRIGHTTNKTAQKTFRDRNLHWYGQHEIKSHHLADSFAKYNFLNTDAAVDLAESASHVEDDLSELLIGPDASRIWHTMIGLIANVRGRLRERNKLLKTLSDERTTLRRIIAPDAKRAQSSDLLRSRLISVIGELSWGTTESTSAQLSRRFVGALTQLISLAEQALKHGSTKSENIKSLDQRRRILRTQVRELQDLINRWKKVEERSEEISQERRTSRAARSSAQKLKRILNSKLLSTLAELNSANASAERVSDILADFEREDIERLRPRFDDLAVKIALETIRNTSTESDKQLSAKRRQLAEYQQLHTHASSLLEQLRDIARDILDSSDDVDVCPLCDTRLPRGKLHQHLREKRPAAQAETALIRSIRDLEKQRDALKIDLSALEWLEGFCKAQRLPTAKTVVQILKAVDQLIEDNGKTEREIARAEEAISALEERGISVEELEQACDDLAAYGFPISERTLSAVDANLAKIDSAEKELSDELTSQSDLLTAVRSSFNQRAERNAGNIGAAQAIVADLQRHHDALDQSLKSLSVMLEKFPWPESRPLSKLVVDATSVEKMASDLQTRLVEEEARRKSEAEANRRLADIDKETKAISLAIDRLDSALEALQDIQKNHSLTGALDQAMQYNREAIEFVFRSIHSPHEFSGLGDSLTKLQRIEPEEEVELTQISTGQRAALALSIFLAQNNQLTVAPPVILIDDPIAHIDDLNCLSFLDYLREVVLTGNRQVFFATANDKLAALITRKFDFLGREDFKRIDLMRPPVN